MVAKQLKNFCHKNAKSHVGCLQRLRTAVKVHVPTRRKKEGPTRYSTIRHGHKALSLSLLLAPLTRVFLGTKQRAQNEKVNR